MSIFNDRFENNMYSSMNSNNRYSLNYQNISKKNFYNDKNFQNPSNSLKYKNVYFNENSYNNKDGFAPLPTTTINGPSNFTGLDIVRNNSQDKSSINLKKEMHYTQIGIIAVLVLVLVIIAFLTFKMYQNT